MFRVINPAPNAKSSPEYIEFWQFLGRSTDDLQPYTDRLCCLFGSVENVLTWHESRVVYCVNNIFNGSKTEQKVINYFNQARKSCNDPRLLKKRKDISHIKTEYGPRYKTQEEMDLTINPPRDFVYVRKAAKFCQLELNTWDDVRLFAFGETNKLHKIKNIPNVKLMVEKYLKNCPKHFNDIKGGYYGQPTPHSNNDGDGDKNLNFTNARTSDNKNNKNNDVDDESKSNHDSGDLLRVWSDLGDHAQAIQALVWFIVQLSNPG